MPTPEDNPRGTPLNASPPPLPPYVTVHSPDCPWRAWMTPYLTHAPGDPPRWGEGPPPSCTCGAPPPCGVIEFSGGLVLGSCENVLGHDGPHSWENEPETPKPRTRADEVLAATRDILDFLETIAGARVSFLPGAVLVALPTIRRALDELEP